MGSYAFYLVVANEVSSCMFCNFLISMSYPNVSSKASQVRVASEGEGVNDYKILKKQ